MKVLMTGATGLIGKEIGKKLVAQGHEVTILTRAGQAARGHLPFPAKVLEWKHHTHSIPSHYFDEIEVVIHLAGESIASGRWNEKRKALIRDSRIIGTKNLVSAILSSKRTVKQFISASAIGIYGDTDHWVKEDDAAAKDFLASVCQGWETESQKLSEIGVAVVNPRIGIVLSRQGGALSKMLFPFSLGLGGAVGNGKQWMSWIHQDDLTNLFLFLLEHPELKGPINAVAPNPVQNREFSQELAKALGRNLFFPVPALVIKLGLGEMSKLVTGGQRVSSHKITSAGFKFRYEHLTEALKDLCAPLKEGKQELLTEIWLPSKVSEVFSFFSDEKNLELLTPEFLNFHVLKKSTAEIQEGTLIDYKLRLKGLPMKWQTKIENWQPNKKFVDTQLKGPYKLWHHTHEFEEVAGGTLIRDRVLYQLPLGRLGQLAAGPMVNADVTKIFSFRRKVITELYCKVEQ